MLRRLWFDLATVLHLAEATINTPHRIDIDGNAVPHTPPALHLMRACGADLDDRLYMDGNFPPGLSEHGVNAEPSRGMHRGGLDGHGITWTEWLGSPPRHRQRIQAQIALLDEARLLDLLRAGHAAGYDMFTIDVGLRASIGRRRERRSRQAPQAGASTTPGPRRGRPTPLPEVSSDHR